MKTKIYWILKIVAAPLIAYLCCIGLAILTNPKTSNDDWAYIYLCYQDKIEDINMAKSYAVAARSCASDFKLYNYADKMVSIWDVWLQAGVARKEEIDSAEGWGKLALFALNNPSIFPKATYETFRTWNLGKDGTQIVDIYAPQIQEIETKRHDAFAIADAVFYIGWIVGWAWLYLSWRVNRSKS